MAKRRATAKPTQGTVKKPRAPKAAKAPSSQNGAPVNGRVTRSQSKSLANTPAPEPLMEASAGQLQAPAEQIEQPSSVSQKKRSRPIESIEEYIPASKRSKGTSTPISPRFPSPSEEPATRKEKDHWQGWCEIESDPDIVSAMIREMGVKGVTVRQAYTMDVDDLQMLPHPIYGLILLFRYREDGGSDQVEECPKNVWFANQMPAQNSCCTLAIMNILLNAKDVELGQKVEYFKEFTADFAPRLRGETFANFQFVKRIHNSYAKKMDMLEDDLQLESKADQNLTSGPRSGFKDYDSEDEEDEDAESNACHFIAFLPIDGVVYKLDGMDRQPTVLGDYDESEPDSWLEVATKRIQALMEESGDLEDFSLLSVTRSPTHASLPDLCKCYVTTQAIESRLDSLSSDWRAFLTQDSPGAAAEPQTPSLIMSFGITQEQLADTKISADDNKLIESGDLEELLSRRAMAVSEQTSLIFTIMNERETEQSQDEQAKLRQFDFGPVVQKWFEFLAEDDYLEENLDKFINK